MENCKEIEAEQKLLALLSETHSWPAHYNFRFIVPKDELPTLKSIIDHDDVVVKPSAKGNYIAVHFLKMINHGEEVLELYRRVKVVKGLVAL